METQRLTLPQRQQQRKVLSSCVGITADTSAHDVRRCCIAQTGHRGTRLHNTCPREEVRITRIAMISLVPSCVSRNSFKSSLIEVGYPPSASLQHTLPLLSIKQPAMAMQPLFANLGDYMCSNKVLPAMASCLTQSLTYLSKLFDAHLTASSRTVSNACALTGCTGGSLADAQDCLASFKDHAKIAVLLTANKGHTATDVAHL